MVDADICVFACTGRVGTVVTRWITDLASKYAPAMTLLLAGRNVAKVRELQARLLADNKDNDVKILVHSEAVDVSDEESLNTMVARARVVVNCITVDCHPRAMQGVAEACATLGVDYLDLAAQRGQLESLFMDSHLNSEAVSNNSRIVPGCGFDYAFFDMAAFQAEKAFAQRYKIRPDKVQATLALRTGPLGVKWPLRLMEHYLELQSSSKARTRAVADASQASTTTRPRRNSSRGCSMLAYSKPLAVWSIPWPLGADAIAFLFCERGEWSPGSVDARIGLPRNLWKAVALVVYVVVTGAIFLPLMIAARNFKIWALKRFLLWVLPTVSLGFFCTDNELCQKSSEQIRIELAVSLWNSSKRGLPLLYHVMGPAPAILNPLCLALSSVELAKNISVKGGVLTPAMAMGETDYWSRLRNACDIKVSVTTE